MSSDGGSGLLSNAGLVQYYDAEGHNAPRIDPRTIIALGIFAGLVTQILNVFVL